MKNIFNHNTTPDAYDPVSMTIITPELGRFVINGTFQDIEPAYDQILREEAAVRRSGKFALSGF